MRIAGSIQNALVAPNRLPHDRVVQPAQAAAVLAVGLFGLSPDLRADAYLFTSFRGNGEDGLHLALSTNGYDWTALGGDKSFLKPEIGGKLMRDPSLAQGPDGKFHSDPFTGDWVEGPSIIQLHGQFIVYFDHYAQPHFYGAVRSADLKSWTDSSTAMHFPPGQRHGTVLRVSAPVAARLQLQR